MKFSRESLLTVLLVVAALGLGSVVTSRLPQPEDVTDQPFVHRGTVGQRVDLRSMSYTLTGVDAAKHVDTGVGKGSSTGLWLLVTLDATPRDKERSVPSTSARIVAADGRRFEGSTGLLTACGVMQPGLVTSCTLVFEVAPDALPGATLHVPAGTQLDVPDDVAVFDLGITGDQPEQWASPEKTITLKPGQPTGVKR